VKVALVAEWLDPWRGGAETSTQQFIHHLMAAGVELHVFTRSRPAATPSMTVHTISGASMSRTRRTMTFAHRVERALKAGSFDVTHAISPCRGVDIYEPRGGTVAESIERNLVLRRAGAARSIKKCANQINFKQRYMLGLERALLGADDGPLVVAISQYVARQLRMHYDLPEERIRVIYNGVNVGGGDAREFARDRAAARREFGIGDDDLLVILIAHNFRLKGVARWMDALSLLVRRGITDVRSLVIGKGESRFWHRRAQRLGISGFLTFTGPTDRISAFQHAGDALVHPTYYDPCSRVVLEGLAAGLPCITTRWDGASEMIRDGINGYVVDDPEDVPAIADRIVQLRSPAQRRSMADAARATAIELGMEKHASRMLSLYEETCSARALI